MRERGIKEIRARVNIELAKSSKLSGPRVLVTFWISPTLPRLSRSFLGTLLLPPTTPFSVPVGTLWTPGNRTNFPSKENLYRVCYSSLVISLTCWIYSRRGAESQRDPAFSKLSLATINSSYRPVLSPRPVSPIHFTLPLFWIPRGLGNSKFRERLTPWGKIHPASRSGHRSPNSITWFTSYALVSAYVCRNRDCLLALWFGKFHLRVILFRNIHSFCRFRASVFARFLSCACTWVQGR